MSGRVGIQVLYEQFVAGVHIVLWTTMKAAGAISSRGKCISLSCTFFPPDLDFVKKTYFLCIKQ